MKFKSGKVCYNFQTDKHGGPTCKFSGDDCFHLHVKCDWATVAQLWPPRSATDQTASGKPAGKPGAKASAKDKDKNKDKNKDKHTEKGGAQANAATDGGGNGEYTWQPKNPFVEAGGDVEDQE